MTRNNNIVYVVAIIVILCCRGCCATAFLCHSSSSSSRDNVFGRRHNKKNQDKYGFKSLCPSLSTAALRRSSSSISSSKLFMVSSSLTPPGGGDQQQRHHHHSTNNDKKEEKDDNQQTPSPRDRNKQKSIIGRRRNLISAIKNVNLSHDRGTMIHLLYATLMLVIPTLFSCIPKFRGSCSKLTRYSMIFSFFGMFYDNVICGLGKYIVGKDDENDENSHSNNNRRHQLLRKLTKGRYLFHAAVMPLVFIPMLEVCTFMDNVNGMSMKNHVNVVSTCFIVALGMAVMECIDWIRYDSNNFIPIDQRYSKHNIQHHLAGTYKYTCPNIIKCVVPAIITTLLQIIVGFYITISSISSSRSATLLGGVPFPAQPSLASLISFPFSTIYLPGLLILCAGCTALLSATIFSKKPQVQLVLEPLSVAMIWSSASCLY